MRHRPSDEPADGEAAEREHQRIQHLARALELRARRLVQGQLGGAYRSVYRGAGIEFAEARPYLPGDDVRRIDWNVTARMGEPWVKEYVEERELTVVTAVDCSASTAVGHLPGGRRQQAAACTALLSMAAAVHHDRAGLLLFSDRTERYIEPRHTTRHAMRLVHEVLTHRPAGRGTDLGGAARMLGATLRRRSVIFLVTDGFDAGYEQPLRALARRHDVTVLQLDDPADRALPPVGLVELLEPERGRRTLVDAADPAVRAAFAEAASARRRHREVALANAGVASVTIPLEEDPLTPLLAHIHRRAEPAARGRAG